MEQLGPFLRCAPALVGVGVLAFAPSLKLPSATAATAPPGTWLDLTFENRAPGATLQVSRSSAFVLRADKNLTELKVQLQPASGSDAGRWAVRVIRLPRTEEADPPNLEKVDYTNVTWRVDEVIRREKRPAATLRSAVPRAWLDNWLLFLEPRSGAEPLQVIVNSSPADRALRARWVYQSRLQCDPEREPDGIRRLARQLSDGEIRYWAGVRDRRTFLRIWNRATPEDLAREYRGEEDVTFPPHPLPGGLIFQANALVGSGGDKPPVRPGLDPDALP